MSTEIPPSASEQDAAHRTTIEEAARDLEAVLHEVKRVVIGQDAMLERVLVALLAGGHVLLEGVPGLAKTLTVKTLSSVLGGQFRRVQFTPDLVPADLVGTRIWRPDTGTFETQLGPVFGNLLLADEINRAPAKVQSALLEVMQERQVTLGGETFPLPSPFLVLATQNPIESEGTYPLPEAQVDRFLLKVVVGYPSIEDEASVVHASVGGGDDVREIITPDRLLAHRRTVRDAHVDPQVVRFAVALADATRHPSRYGLADLEGAIDVGASPRGPIGMVQAAQALAVLRGRDYVTTRDVRALAPDVLRHRLVLSYEAHADGMTPDDVLTRVLRAVDPNAGEPARLTGGGAGDRGGERAGARGGGPAADRGARADDPSARTDAPAASGDGRGASSTAAGRYDTDAVAGSGGVPGGRYDTDAAVGSAGAAGGRYDTDAAGGSESAAGRSHEGDAASGRGASGAADLVGDDPHGAYGAVDAHRPDGPDAR